VPSPPRNFEIAFRRLPAPTAKFPLYRLNSLAERGARRPIFTFLQGNVNISGGSGAAIFNRNDDLVRPPGAPSSLHANFANSNIGDQGSLPSFISTVDFFTPRFLDCRKSLLYLNLLPIAASLAQPCKHRNY
jgi:hypothetical protein